MQRVGPWAIPLLFVVAVTACDREPDVGFEVRPFTLLTEENAYSTGFQHQSVIVATGEDAKGSYLVLLRLYQSGGDPTIRQDSVEEITLPVIGGFGDIRIYGGSRNKQSPYQAADTWEPAKMRAEVLGFVPIRTIQAPK